MKTCCDCGIAKSMDDFYRHPYYGDGRLPRCKPCHRSYVSSYRKKNAEHYRDYEKLRAKTKERKSASLEYKKKSRKERPGVDAARCKLARAVRSGKLTPVRCGVCGHNRVQAHHVDYGRPLDVEWLCYAHHMEAHGKSASVPDNGAFFEVE